MDKLTAGTVLNLEQAATAAGTAGARAARLGQLIRLGLPVPPGVVLDFDAVRHVAETGRAPAVPAALGPLLALRGSASEKRFGGPQAMLNLGMSDDLVPALSSQIGRRGALEVYRRSIQTYGVRVAGLDPEDFENLFYDRTKLSPLLSEDDLAKLVETSKALYADETGEAFPQGLDRQLPRALAAMAREWESPSARILRQAAGAGDADGLGLIVQRMVFGLGGTASGAGSFQPVDSSSGKRAATGRYLPDAQGSDAKRGVRTAHLITRAERDSAGQTQPSLEEMHPDLFGALVAASDRITAGLRDVFEIPFTNAAGTLWVLDAEPVARSARASIQIAVDLVASGAIDREMALLRVEPRSLAETLHPQIDPSARRDVFGTGLPASPGAASGRIHFSPAAAMAAHAQGDAVILVRPETSPEDIRGMHAAAGVLTVRGGMTSHAAVIARGLGLPCVVGASDLQLNLKTGELKARDGRIFRQGDLITVDGSAGQALAGAPQMLAAVPSDAFGQLMAWADETRAMGVRVNADTPSDAQVARRFKVDGIGLCRTEHMFFEEGRIDVMREMILAETQTKRVAALEKLLPMQRQDFEDLFEIMSGLPVTIRLLDPPLHEFLPHGDDEMARLAQSMGLPVASVRARADELHEFNPMLGMRGVRLGITMPEIYDMQARAIFEATVGAARKSGAEVIPEIMIPLVSANREVELVKSRVDAVAMAVQKETGTAFRYKIGVMVETPRGALRAGDLARSSAFLSFGTNDLTQMTYGLSRDDAGRFMRDYVAKGVFPEDPFHTLDVEGVGELLLMAARRGRQVNPDVTLGLCGEHGGDPQSIRFCAVAGFDYVSCSAFRVPIARLAAAQAAILTGKSPQS